MENGLIPDTLYREIDFGESLEFRFKLNVVLFSLESGQARSGSGIFRPIHRFLRLAG